MASPRGHVLFSFVIPPPPLLSAYCLSDKNPPVMLLQKRVGKWSKRKWTESLPMSEGSSHNLEKRVSVHLHGPTGWYLKIHAMAVSVGKICS